MKYRRLIADHLTTQAVRVTLTLNADRSHDPQRHRGGYQQAQKIHPKNHVRKLPKERGSLRGRSRNPRSRHCSTSAKGARSQPQRFGPTGEMGPRRNAVQLLGLLSPHQTNHAFSQWKLFLLAVVLACSLWDALACWPMWPVKAWPRHRTRTAEHKSIGSQDGISDDLIPLCNFNRF